MTWGRSRLSRESSISSVGRRGTWATRNGPRHRTTLHALGHPLSPAQEMGSCVQAVEGAGAADIHVQRRGRGSDRAELSILRRDANLDFREVDLGLGDNVKVVGEDIQRDVRDDLTDFS